MKAWALLIVGGAIVAGFQGRQGGGPPLVYRTEHPEQRFDVIAGAPTGTEVTLSVRGDADKEAVLLVTDDAGIAVATPKLPQLSSKPTEVKVRGLKPGKRYSYLLKQGSEEIRGAFRTAPSAGNKFSFAIQADSHLDGNSGLDVYERTLQNIVKDKPDFLIDLGDTFMVDKYPTYTDSEKQYLAQRYWFSKVGSQMSVFLCLGNHDGEVGWPSRGGADVATWSRQQRQLFFPVIKPNEFYSGAPAKGLYYAWNWGDATFVVLDPFVATTRKGREDKDGWNWTLGKDQFDWLGRTLKESKAKYKFVFIHHLVGGFGGSEARGGVEAADRFEWGDHEEFPVRRSGWAEPIHALMVKHKVSALFHGHDHLYVLQQKDGITYLEVPQPSHARGDSVGSAEEYGYKTGTLLGSSGHIRVSVGPDSAKLEYVKSMRGTENGKVVDSHEIKPIK